MSAVALVAALLVIPSSRASSRVPLDLGGAVVLSAGIVPLLLAIAQGESWGWDSAAVVGLFAGSAVILAGWVRMQLTRTSPLVDLRQLRHRVVLAANFAALVLGTALYMFLSLVTEFVQMPTDYGFAAATVVAGLCVLPFSVASFATSRAVEAVMRCVGARGTLVAGCLTLGAGGAFFALVHRELWEAFLAMGMIGIGVGLTFAALPGLIALSVPHRDLGSAMGFFQVIRSIGFSMGSALTAAILAGHTPPAAGHPDLEGFLTALWVGAAICVVAAVVTGGLARGAVAGGRPVPARHQRGDVLA
jgi:hypothetical protein